MTARPDLPLDLLLEYFTDKVISERLELFGLNVSQTARSLGVHRNTLIRQIKKLGLREKYSIPRSHKT